MISGSSHSSSLPLMRAFRYRHILLTIDIERNSFRGAVRTTPRLGRFPPRNPDRTISYLSLTYEAAHLRSIGACRYKMTENEPLGEREKILSPSHYHTFLVDCQRFA